MSYVKYMMNMHTVCIEVGNMYLKFHMFYPWLLPTEQNFLLTKILNYLIPKYLYLRLFYSYQIKKESKTIQQSQNNNNYRSNTEEPCSRAHKTNSFQMNSVMKSFSLACQYV